LRLAAPLLLLAAVQDVAQGMLAGVESFRALARVSAMAGGALALGMMGGAVGFGLPGCVLGMVIGMTFGCALSLRTVLQELKRASIPFGWKGWRSELTTLWSFALPAALSGSVVIPVNWLANAILVHQPGGYEEMGIFNAANQWRNLILDVPSLVAAAGLPVLANLWQRAVGSEYLRVLRLKMGLGLFSALVLAVPAMAGAQWIMKGYGPGFARGADVLVMLAGAGIITATLSVVGQALVSEGRMWTGFLLNCVWAIVLLGLAARWIPANGALGLAWANLGAFGVHLVTVSGYFWWMCRRQRPPGSETATHTPIPPSPSAEV
jgi:O-antigen/teichoic acid export membrane protein